MPGWAFLSYSRSHSLDWNQIFRQAWISHFRRDYKLSSNRGFCSAAGLAPQLLFASLQLLFWALELSFTTISFPMHVLSEKREHISFTFIFSSVEKTLDKALSSTKILTEACLHQLYTPDPVLLLSAVVRALPWPSDLCHNSILPYLSSRLSMLLLSPRTSCLSLTSASPSHLLSPLFVP